MRREVGTIREVQPGVWTVQVSLGRDPVTGRRRRPCRTVRGNKRDAERVLARLMAEAGKAHAASLTVQDFLEGMYFPHLRDRVKAGGIRVRTVDEYEAKLRRHALPALGGARLAELTPYRLDRWLSSLADRQLSPRTRLHVYRALSTAIATAVRWRLMSGNPLAAVDSPSVPREAPVVLSIEQANAYLDAFADHALEPVVAIALGAGLRRSEICALEWSDFDFEAGTVAVTKGRHQRRGDVWNEPPKSETSRRVVSLPEWALDILRRHRGLGPVCGPLKPDQVSYRYRKHVEASKLPWCPLKNLRHSSATIALALGVDVVVVSRRMGHSTVSITDQFYLAPGRAADVAAAERMGGLRPLPTAAANDT